MKKYLICLRVIPKYEELRIEAENKKEARKKVEMMLDGNFSVYDGMEIDNIEEIK